jgi:hypothetical protein
MRGVTLACMACDWRGWRAMIGERSIRKYTGTIREDRVASNEECMVPVRMDGTSGLYLHQRNGTVTRSSFIAGRD